MNVIHLDVHAVQRVPDAPRVLLQAQQQHLHRVYSYSDRIRYYWPDAAIEAAVQKLFVNLARVSIPEPLLSQHLPRQYQAVREGRLAAQPKALALDRVRDALRPYAAACGAMALPKSPNTPP